MSHGRVLENNLKKKLFFFCRPKGTDNDGKNSMESPYFYLVQGNHGADPNFFFFFLFHISFFIFFCVLDGQFIVLPFIYHNYKHIQMQSQTFELTQEFQNNLSSTFEAQAGSRSSITSIAEMNTTVSRLAKNRNHLPKIPRKQQVQEQHPGLLLTMIGLAL